MGKPYPYGNICFSNLIKHKRAVERSETEGEKAINIKLSVSLPQSFFFEK